MISFGVVENLARILGILEPNAPGFFKKYLINVCHRCATFSIILFNIIPPMWFFIFEAETFKEYAEIMTVVVGVSVALTSYWTLLWDKHNILELMDDLNSLIELSK